MNVLLSYCGGIIEDGLARKTLGADYYPTLEKLTKITPQKIGADKVMRNFRTMNIGGKECVVFPRRYVLEMPKTGVKITKIINKLNEGRPIAAPDFGAELSPNQEIVVRHLFATEFAGRIGSAVINLKAGQGKTFVAGAMIAKLARRALYVVFRESLQSQVCRDLKGCLPAAKIAKFGKDSDTADVVVIVINSAVRQPQTFFAGFGFVILDEIHSYCSEKWAEIFWKAGSKYMLGMSATTDMREDGFDIVYHHHLGEVIHCDKLAGYDANESEFCGQVVALKYFGPDEYTQFLRNESTNILFTPDMIKQFCADPQRNAAIVDELIALYRDPIRYVMVFSDLREHLEEIAKLIIAAIGDEVDAPEVGIMRGGIKSAAKEKVLTARIILTTYGYSGTGVSIPQINSLVMMTPRKKGHIQFLARAMRKGGDTSIRRIFVDVVDMRTPLKRQYFARCSAYEFYKLEIKDKYVNAED